MSERSKKLIQYIVPAVLTNVCFFLLTIVDGIFVGNGVGTNALGAVNLVMPFVMFALAIGMMTTIGGVTVAAIRLGRNDVAGANKAFMHSFFATAIVGAVLTIAGAGFTEQMGILLGANEAYLPLVKEYLFWYGVFAIPMLLAINVQGFCRNDGAPMLVAIATAITTLLNIFLDWLFVFPWQMGLTGAALATGMAQSASLFIILPYFLMKKGQLRFGKINHDKKLYQKIVFRGLPEMISQFATPVTTLCMNWVLIRNLGELGVNTYSIISYIASFVMAILFGASEGLQPLFGQSYGAKDDKGLKYFFRSGILISLIGSTLCVLGILALAEPICIMFGADGVTTQATVQYIGPYSWGFVIASVNTLVSAYFYSTKRSKQAIVLNIARGILLNTIIILSLPYIFGEAIIWYTFAIAEAFACALMLALLVYSEKDGVDYH